MALKDLLVYLDQSDRALLRLRLAADLARRHGSRLIAFYIRGLSPDQFARRRSAELGLRSFNEVERLDRRMQDSIAGAADRLRRVLESSARQDNLSIEWREIGSEPIGALTEAARYADLCIVGQDPSDGSSIEYGLGEELLLQSGRPVVFVPPTGQFTTLGKNILIAWDSSRQASCAVNAALPLLERAERVTVVAVNPSELQRNYDGAPAEHLVEHLRHHGTLAAALPIEGVASGHVAQALEGEALELGADMMVAGAYGHARLRERLLGGVTRDLLASMRLPLMMVH